jgi:putative flippase GtrA
VSPLARYRAMPETLRMVCTAVIGALIGLLTYEIIYWCIGWSAALEPRATISWTLAFTLGVARQHGLHRWLTFSEQGSPYWPSLRRAYAMYSGSMVFGAALDWGLTEQLGVHHRLAWFFCLISTATISLVFLKRFVFVAAEPEPAAPDA